MNSFSLNEMRFIWKALSRDQKIELKNDTGIDTYHHFISKKNRNVLGPYLMYKIKYGGWPAPDQQDDEDSGFDLANIMASIANWLDRSFRKIGNFIIWILSDDDEPADEAESPAEKPAEEKGSNFFQRLGVWLTQEVEVPVLTQRAVMSKRQAEVEEEKAKAEDEEKEKKRPMISGCLAWGCGIYIFMGLFFWALITAAWFLPEISERAATEGLTWSQLIFRIILTGN